MSRREWILVGVLLLSGVVLRFAFPSHMAVEHFDEGVYASNIWFGPEDGNQYPMRHLYAPPLLPALIETSILVEQVAFGPRTPSSLAVMMPSLLAGSLTPLLVWWMTRSWFSPVAGVAAMAVAATSDFHAVYSRAALTDVLMVFFTLLAVWQIGEGLSRQRMRCLVFGGIATGLAWWTKYNGWLPLAISLTTIVATVVMNKQERPRAGRWLVSWLLVAVIATSMFGLYVRELQPQGGYAAVAANHKQYVVGIEGWFNGFTRQAGNLRHFDGWWSCAGVLTALALSTRLFTRPESDKRGRGEWYRLVSGVGIVSAIALFCGGFVGVWLVGLLAFVRPIAGYQRQRLGFWLLAAWYVGLLVATPLYHPYPRLTLPWLCATWIAFGIAVDRLLTWLAADRAAKLTSLVSPPRALVASGLVVAIAVGFGARHFVGVPPAWKTHNGLQAVVHKIRAGDGHVPFPPAANKVVLVYGEPALFFHMRAAGYQTVAIAALGPLGSVGEGPSTYLLVGPHAHRSASFDDQWRQYEERCWQVSSEQYQASDMVLLNQFSAGELGPDYSEVVVLYGVRTSSADNP